MVPDSKTIESFRATVRERGRTLYRDLPWRDVRDPYAVLVSEVMLQQTQVKRVLGFWGRWLETFPTLDALAAAPTSLVLERWQGLGYNRRALALKRTAEICSEEHAGVLPVASTDLLLLPGVGPSTAAGIRVFAYGLADVYLETNVRTVFLHELFPDEMDVPDTQIVPLVERACDWDDPRGWYYALLDYGAYLKTIMPNPSRRSRHHVRQSAFEGSRRQKRAWLLQAVLAGDGLSTDELAVALDEWEAGEGRPQTSISDVEDILADLAAERFMTCCDGVWKVSD